MSVKGFFKSLLGAKPATPQQAQNKALWAISIFSGSSPVNLKPDPRIVGPVITRDHVTDVPAAFVADPFLLQHNGTWHLFFELLNKTNKRGEIGLATSADLISWKYERVVLTEPFHLSYPHVFEWNGAYYMIPETYFASEIRLYKAEEFPYKWKFERTLMKDCTCADSTVFQSDGRWWMFTDASPKMTHDTLRLFYANDLLGNWTEHPISPVVEGNTQMARPAGAVVKYGSGFVRYAQHCGPKYGMAVRAFEITALTPTSYAERPVSEDPILAGSGKGWNATRMHHVDAHEIEPNRWIAAVDGAHDVTADDIWGT